MPFFQAAAATAGGGVLGDEDGVAAKRGLLAVVWNHGRGQPPGDKILRVREYDRQTLAAQVIEILAAQLEAAAEIGFLQGSEKLVQVAHEIRESIGWRR